MRLLALDPSGSFNEGKGNTGWVLFENNKVISFGQLKAKDYESREDYWYAHKSLIKEVRPDEMAIEDFRLYGHKAKAQINSEMETSKLIGYLQMTLWSMIVPYQMQQASQAKPRFTDEILIRKGYITKDENNRIYINGVNVSGHIVDALRHGAYYKLIQRKRNKK